MSGSRLPRLLLVGMGEAHHVGAFFRNSLARAGAAFAFVDEAPYLAPLQRSLAARAFFRLFRRPPGYRRLNEEIVQAARRFSPQVVLVCKGAFIAPGTLQQVRQASGAVLVNFATDDPCNPVNATRDLRLGIPCYDLYACTKTAILEDVRRAGCRQTIYVPFAYEPAAHYPEAPANQAEEKRFACDVAFIGGADRDRAGCFQRLPSTPGIRLRLYGGYWDRYPEFRPYYSGFVFDRDYRLAIGGAKISLGMVRRANRDGHSMRSFEIPACGGFLLAERTAEHQALFEEGKEMVSFADESEMQALIRDYCRLERERKKIAEAGYARITRSGNTYADRLEQILAAAGF